jgi:hypothetical protein
VNYSVKAPPQINAFSPEFTIINKFEEEPAEFT